MKIKNKKLKVLLVFGTRPEAIKMAPVFLELQKREDIEPYICVTAQHREMLDQVLELFKIKPDYDLNIMVHNQDLWTLTASVICKMKEVYLDCDPHIVLVHGDTTTTMASTISAFYSKIPVGHVEAGLRTFDNFYPFPEEINRVITDNIASFFFAPTDTSIDNLFKTGISSKHIYKTGNTVIDSFLYTIKTQQACLKNIPYNPSLKNILITCHRRENFGKPLENICQAIIDLVDMHQNIQFIYPVHLNPNVKQTVNKLLKNKERIILIDPLDYGPFATLMSKCHLILTDSGGIQEEAPSIGIPVLVLREETERPEAVEYGTVKLVGTNKDNIKNLVSQLLSDTNFYNSMSNATNPYGDGHASTRIADILVANKDTLVERCLHSRLSQITK